MIAKIKSKSIIAQNTLRVEFELSERINFKAGQYCIMELINPKLPDERNNRRSFSIVNSPNEPNQIVITTRLSESGFKRNLNEMVIGDTVDIKNIAGVFTLPDNAEQSLVFLSGGIGITPFMSMLTFVTQQHLPYKITLVYSNRNQESTAYLNELKDLESQNSNLRIVLIMTEDPSWVGEKRKIDSTLIKEYFPEINASKYLVVGPPGMVSAIEQELLTAGVIPENIQKENFSGYA